jgi:membrane protein required for colicin V production
MMMGLSVVDWGIVLVLVLSVLEAAAQGFLYELFALAGAVVGYLVAAWEYPRLAAWYMQYMNSQWAADIAGFLTIFVVIALLGSAIGRIARWAVSGVGLRWFDRVLGGAFGFIRGVAVCTVFIMALAAFSPTSGYLQQSRVAPFLLVTGRALIWAAPADLRQKFRDGWNLLRSVPEHMQHGDASER